MAGMARREQSMRIITQILRAKKQIQQVTGIWVVVVLGSSVRDKKYRTLIMFDTKRRMSRYTSTY
jgi:hypothetical protein